MNFNDIDYTINFRSHGIPYTSLRDALEKNNYPKTDATLVKDLLASKYSKPEYLVALYNFEGFNGTEDKKLEDALFEFQERMLDYPSITSKPSDVSFVGKDVVVQEKLDGANAQFLIWKSQLKLRNRRYELPEDGFGSFVPFMDFARSKEAELKEKGYTHLSFFGEYVTKNVISYAKEYRKQWYLFDIFNRNTGMFLAYDDVVAIAKDLNLKMPKVFYRGVFRSDLIEYVGKSEMADNIGEGTVVKLTEERNRESEFHLKMVHDNFKETKLRIKGDKGKDPIDVLLDSVVEKNRVLKMIHKQQDNGVLPKVLNAKEIGMVLSKVNQEVYEDVLAEEWASIEKLLKKKIQKRVSLHAAKLVQTGEADRI